MKVTAVIQSNYIPWKGYFDLINNADELILYDEMQYTKNDWRNRNQIKTRNGKQWLTIPVKQNTLSQRIVDTKIAMSNWGKKHWNALCTNYSKAPYFKCYRHCFEPLYLSNKFEYLSEVNYAFICLINKILGIKTTISWSHEYYIGEGRTDRLVNLCLQSRASHYLSGPAAESYLDCQKFIEAGVKIMWMDYNRYPQYRQIHPPFEHHVSIVDLIFNEGPNAPKFMKSFGR